MLRSCLRIRFQTSSAAIWRTVSTVFWPATKTTGPVIGNGLGLATVFGIVEQSQGHIVVESKPGEGTVFHIHLPHVAAPEKAPRSDVAQPDTARATETVLLVEDEPMVRALVEEILAGRGYNVLTAASPEHALKLSAEYADEIDLLLTDVVMPEMNGRQLVERIQIGRPNIRTLYISGYTSDAVLARGVLSADVSFLQKPFTASQLTEKAREALKR